MLLVILAQSAATSRAYAVRYNQRFQENTDLVGLGLANLTAGSSGTFPVNGSPTKTDGRRGQEPHHFASLHDARAAFHAASTG
jgi:hypothetical protein